MPNHRGITITSTISKAYEHAVLQKTGPISQSGLQFGFSNGLCPQMATVCFTEAIACSNKEGTDLYVATLDTEKAFDVVSHPILLVELYNKGISADLWLAIEDLYRDLTECVTWAGSLSREYNILQGVGQGRILSPTLYKVYMDNLLTDLEQSGYGTYIGSVFIGSPTVADDVLLIDTSPGGMQHLLDTCYSTSCHKRYNIHPTKSEVTSKRTKKCPPFTLGPNHLPVTEQVTHLGLTRNLRTTAGLVHSRVETARRTVYSLMPAGLHGENGLSPVASRKLLTSYILPRMLYGLEAVILTKSDITALETYYKGLLRSLMSLRDGTASEAVYLLSGLFPIEAELHVRTLNLFGAISRLPTNTPLHRIAERQISMNEEVRHSWFIYAMEIGKRYGITHALLGSLVCPWEKQRWKTFISNTIYNHWFDKLIIDSSSKSSLKYLDLDKIRPHTPHHIWPTRGCGSRSRVAAGFRAKLLSGGYILQATRARFNQFAVNPSCQLCGHPVEDIPHFLLECPALDSTRCKHMMKIDALLQQQGLTIPDSREAQCKLILNCGDRLSCILCKAGSKHRIKKQPAPSHQCRKEQSVHNQPSCQIQSVHTQQQSNEKPILIQSNSKDQPAHTRPRHMDQPSHTQLPSSDGPTIVTSEVPIQPRDKSYSSTPKDNFNTLCDAFKCCAVPTNAFTCTRTFTPACDFTSTEHPACVAFTSVDSSFIGVGPDCALSTRNTPALIGVGSNEHFNMCRTNAFSGLPIVCTCRKICDTVNILCLDLHNKHTQILGSKELEAPRRRRKQLI